MLQEWNTVAEIAAYDGCSEKTIRNYIKFGYLKAHRRGPRSIFINIDDYSAMYRPYGKSYERKY
jgi:predicted ATPase